MPSRQAVVKPRLWLCVGCVKRFLEVYTPSFAEGFIVGALAMLLLHDLWHG